MLSLLVAAYAMSGSVAAQDTYELTFSTYLPPSYEYVWKPIEDFVAQIEEESDGRVKINVFHSAQLFDGYDELPALSRGDVDLEIGRASCRERRENSGGNGRMQSRRRGRVTRERELN